MRHPKVVFRFTRQSLIWSLFPLVWVMVRILRQFSLEARFRVIRTMARFVYWLWIGRRAMTRRNLALLRPDLTESRITEGSWRVVETVARSWAALLGDEGTSAEAIMQKLEVRGSEGLLEYHCGGKKIIAVADHVGPFDEMIGIIPSLGLRVYVPIEPLKPEWFLNLMMRLYDWALVVILFLNQ